MKFFVFVLAALFSTLPALAHDKHHHQDLKAAAPLNGASIYNLSDSWLDQNGTKIQLKSFAGKKVVIAMVYLTCKSACPVLTADMKRIASQVTGKAQGNVQFVLASIDPKRDVVAELKKFSNQHHLGAEFTVVTGSASAVRSLAGVLGVQYKQEKNGEFQHSNLITLLDEQGVVKVQVQGLGADASSLVQALR